MAGVFPFRGVHYRDLAQLGRVVAPPYDVISPTEQQALYDASPHNIIRLEYGQRDGDQPGREHKVAGPGSEAFYDRAASLLDAWLGDGVLERDPSPAFYVYRQLYTLPGQPPRARTGVFAEVRLEDFSSGIIRPHEETFSGPKEDRLRLLRACRANLSPIFGLYRDVPEATAVIQAATARSPLADFSDRLGLRHQLWRLDSNDACETVTRGLSDRSILIADGHHRYETALAYRAERCQQHQSAPAGAAEPWYDRVLFVLVSMADPGLVVLPTHRILGRIPGAGLLKSRLKSGAMAPVPCDPGAIQESLDRTADDGQSRFVLVMPDGCYAISLPETGGEPVDRLDVTRLHRELLPALTGMGDPHELAIEYTQDPAAALDAVRSGRAPAAILVNPTPVERVDAVAASGARMPEKSTYFYPKLSTGLVLRVEDRGEA